MNAKWGKYTRRYEGLNLMPYQCPGGHLTIGYGHNLENGISKEVAEFMLKQDLATAQLAVSKKFPWWNSLDEVRQFVLVDMCFNMGLSKLCTFKKMLSAMERGDYHTAANEALASKWAVQVSRRARELANMLKTGEYI